MSRTKGLVDGYWYYYIYDVDTNELLAQGTEAECCEKLKQCEHHYHHISWQMAHHPERVPKWEIVKRKWIPYTHELRDTKTGERFKGSKAECRKWMEKQMNRELTDANFNNYWYRSVRRFERRSNGFER